MHVGVEQGVALLLPAVGVEALAEVAVPVEQPDADQRHAEVARRLEVVAGQHAEAAGVLGDRLGDAELGREVGDEVERAVAAGLEPPVAVEVPLELAVHLAEEPPEAAVVGEGVEPLARHEPEEADGVVDAGVPQVGVDPPEQVAGLVVPRPPQVEGQLLEGGELGGQGRANGEAAKGLHQSRTVASAGRTRRLRPATLGGIHRTFTRSPAPSAGGRAEAHAGGEVAERAGACARVCGLRSTHHPSAPTESRSERPDVPDALAKRPDPRAGARRTVVGMSAVLAAVRPPTARSTGPSFEALLAAHARRRAHPRRSTWTPATCSCSTPPTRARVLDVAAAVCGASAFVAGAFVADRPGDPLDLDGHVRALDAVAGRGGTPVVFPSHGLNGGSDDDWVAALAGAGPARRPVHRLRARPDVRALRPHLLARRLRGAARGRRLHRGQALVAVPAGRVGPPGGARPGPARLPRAHRQRPRHRHGL